MSQCRKFAVLWTFTVIALSIASFAIYRKFLASDTNSGGTSEKLSAGNFTGSNTLKESTIGVNPATSSTLRSRNILTSSTQTVQTLSNQSPGGVSYVQDVTRGEESTARANRSEKTCRTATASTPDLVLNAPEIFHVIFNVLNIFGVPLSKNYTRDSSALNSVVNDSDPPISKLNEESHPDFRVNTLQTRTGSKNEFAHEPPQSDPSPLDPSDVPYESTPNLVNERGNRTSQFSNKDQRNESELNFSTRNVMLVNNTSQMKVSQSPMTNGYFRTVEIGEDRVPENSLLYSRNIFDGSKTDSVHWSSSAHTPPISFSRNIINYGSFLGSHTKIENSDSILYPIDNSRVSSPSVQKPHSTRTSHSVSSGPAGRSHATPGITVVSEFEVNSSPTYTSAEALQSPTHHINVLINTAETKTFHVNPVTSTQTTTRYLPEEASFSSLQNNTPNNDLVKAWMTTVHSRFNADNLPSSDVNENSSPKDNISDSKVATVPSRIYSYFAPIKINSAGHNETDAVTMHSPSVNNLITNPDSGIGSSISSSNLDFRGLVEDPAPSIYPSTNAPTLLQTTVINHLPTNRSNAEHSHAHSLSTPHLDVFKSTKQRTTVSTTLERSPQTLSTTTDPSLEENVSAEDPSEDVPGETVVVYDEGYTNISG